METENSMVKILLMAFNGLPNDIDKQSFVEELFQNNKDLVSKIYTNPNIS